MCSPFLEFQASFSGRIIAQGGVACVLDTVHDSYKLHITDTLIAGKYKNTLSAVEKLVTEEMCIRDRLMTSAVYVSHFSSVLL